MAIRVVRLGTPRSEDEGLRLGTVRRPPRGVRKEDLGRRDYFDVWVPDLAPSASLVSWGRSEPFTPKRWATFMRRYRAEMRKPAMQRLIALVAALSARQDFSVGCYCEDESQCHRSALRELLRKAGAVMADPDRGVRPAATAPGGPVPLERHSAAGRPEPPRSRRALTLP